MLVTYQKRNGDIIQRTVRNYPPYRVGETTCMGWKLLDIKQYYKGKYYSQMEYDRLIDKDYKKMKKQIQFRKKFILLYKQLAYTLSLLILMKVLERITIYNFL